MMMLLFYLLLFLAFNVFFVRALLKIYDGIYYILFDSSYDLLSRGFYLLFLLFIFLMLCLVYRKLSIWVQKKVDNEN